MNCLMGWRESTLAFCTEWKITEETRMHVRLQRRHMNNNVVSPLSMNQRDGFFSLFRSVFYLQCCAICFHEWKRVVVIITVTQRKIEKAMASSNSGGQTKIIVITSDEDIIQQISSNNIPIDLNSNDGTINLAFFAQLSGLVGISIEFNSLRFQWFSVVEFQQWTSLQACNRFFWSHSSKTSKSFQEIHGFDLCYMWWSCNWI